MTRWIGNPPPAKRPQSRTPSGVVHAAASAATEQERAQAAERKAVQDKLAEELSKKTPGVTTRVDRQG